MSTHLSSISARHSHFYSAVNVNKGGNAITDVTPNTYAVVVNYNERRAAFTIQNKGSVPINVRLDDVDGQPIFSVIPSQYLTLTPASTISVSSTEASVPFAWLEETVRR